MLDPSGLWFACLRRKTPTAPPENQRRPRSADFQRPSCTVTSPQLFKTFTEAREASERVLQTCVSVCKRRNRSHIFAVIYEHHLETEYFLNVLNKSKIFIKFKKYLCLKSLILESMMHSIIKLPEQKHSVILTVSRNFLFCLQENCTGHL